MRLAGARFRGLVDRVCEVDGRIALVDYKTNAKLDPKLLDAYTLQLRLYHLAASRGLLPGGAEPDLILFDLRHGEAIRITPDESAVMERVVADVGKIVRREFALGPEHAERPCVLCAYRPICKDARK
jgi:RecB family exonuclease